MGIANGNRERGLLNWLRSPVHWNAVLSCCWQDGAGLSLIIVSLWIRPLCSSRAGNRDTWAAPNALLRIQSQSCSYVEGLFVLMILKHWSSVLVREVKTITSRKTETVVHRLLKN